MPRKGNINCVTALRVTASAYSTGNLKGKINAPQRVIRALRSRTYMQVDGVLNKLKLNAFG